MLPLEHCFHRPAELMKREIVKRARAAGYPSIIAAKKERRREFIKI